MSTKEKLNTMGEHMKKNYNFNFSLLYLIYFGALGAAMPYINVYLEKSAHLTGSQIGILTALSQIIGFLIIPIWGIVGDKTKRYNVLLRISIGGSLVMVLFYQRAAVYPVILICAIGLEMLRLGAVPMADTIAMNFCHKTKSNYGIIRAMGALGYMLSSIIVGFLADKIGLDGPLFATYTFLLIIALPLTFLLPKDERVDKSKAGNDVKKGSFKELITNKNFMFILLITTLSTVLVDSSMTYAGNHLVTTLNSSESNISYLTFITVFPEVFFLAISQKLISKLGFKKYYSIVIFTMIIRFVVYSTTHNIYLFLIVGIVHCLEVSISTVGNLAYTRRCVSPQVLGTAITLLNAAASIGTAIYGYIFGFIYEYFSSYTIFLVCTICLILALVLLIRNKNFDDVDIKA